MIIDILSPSINANRSHIYNLIGVIIVNALRKSLLVAASFAAFGVCNSAMAELVYKPVEQPVEAPNPNLKIDRILSSHSTTL